MSGKKALAELYAAGASVTAVVKEALARAAGADRNEWIYRLPEADVLARAAALEKRAAALDEKQRAAELPLLGMVFAVKDNMAVKGTPITNAMDYRNGGAPVSTETAAAVERLVEGGAVLIGKTNMDCAATGLVGVRSAYGACQNALDRSFISGGSSSGSAVAVATGQVSFALGTDTAGSGRVPAMLNNIVGLKASRGLISAHGVLPACRSLDCVSVFASTVQEAWAVLRVAASAEGGDDPWDRPHAAFPSLGPRLPPSGTSPFRFAIPSKEYLDFNSFGDAQKERAPAFAEAWAKSLDALKALGGTCVEVDYTPFQNAATMLYEGPWVAERFSALEELLGTKPEIIHPIVRKIVEPAGKYSAKEAFEAAYKMKELKQKADAAMKAAGAQILVTPTAGATYTIAQVEADPVMLNKHMGRYTNHMNLLDLCGIAVPTVMAGKLPFGLTISAAAGLDSFICDIATRLHAASGLPAGATASSAAAVMEASASRSAGFLQGVETFEIAVSGAHMEGLALNAQLTARGARFLRRAKTAARYRLLAYDGMKPPRPGVRGAAGKEEGKGIEVEVWEMPSKELGTFAKLIAVPLGLGWVEMEDGSKVQGFRLIDAEADAAGRVPAQGEAPSDITAHGGWRKYLESSGEAAAKQPKVSPA